MSSAVPFVVTVDPCLVPRADEDRVRDTAMDLATRMLERRGLTMDPDGDDEVNNAYAEAIVAMFVMCDVVLKHQTYASQWVAATLARLFHSGDMHKLLSSTDPDEFRSTFYRVVGEMTQSLLVVLAVTGAASVVLPSDEEYAMEENEEARAVEVGVSFPSNPAELVESLVLDEAFLLTEEEEDAWDMFFGGEDDE